MYSVGDRVRLYGEVEYRTIIGIRVETYFGIRGNVSTGYVLYLGDGLWKTAKAKQKHLNPNFVLACFYCTTQKAKSQALFRKKEIETYD